MENEVSAPCVLCDILGEDKNCQLLYRDEHIFVVMNVEPVKDGHMMILPIRHAKNLSDLNAGEASAFLSACDKSMRIVERLFSDEGPICIVNGWKHRSQEHLHAHVLPSKSSLRKLYMVTEGTPLRVRLDPEAMKEKGKRIREQFARV